MTLTITMQYQRHENDDVNNRVTKAMTDDKEHNIDRDNRIVNENNEDKERFFFFFLSREENILSPRSESNLRPSDFALQCFTTEPQRLHGERSLLQSSCDTRPTYC